MSHRSSSFRPFFFAIAALLLWHAPATAQTQGGLAGRTITVLKNLCAAAPSNTTLATGSCDVGAGIAGPAQQAQDALTISPREQTAASSTATHTTDTQVSAEAERLEKVRLADLKAGEPRVGAFLNGSGGFGKVKARGEAEQYDVWGGGAQLGVDYRLSDTLVAGLGFGWNRQNTEFDKTAAATANLIANKVGGGEIQSDSYTPSLYASFFSGPFHADGIFTYTYLDYEYERPVALIGVTNPFSATAKGDTNANQIGASVNLGYEFQHGGLGVGPIAGVDYRQTWIDGYSESGVPGFPLRYRDQDILSLVTNLGAEASYAISTGIGVLVPHIRGTWEHEFENDARNIDARLFVNDSSASDVLITRTESPDRNWARLGAGVSAQFPHGIAAFVDYDTVLGLSKVEQHRFTAGGRIAF
jgi:outer membrane lipase/esterase